MCNGNLGVWNCFVSLSKLIGVAFVLGGFLNN